MGSAIRRHEAAGNGPIAETFAIAAGDTVQVVSVAMHATTDAANEALQQISLFRDRIFTIPFARAFRDAVEERIGLRFFVYTTVVIALGGGAVALANIRRRNLPRSAYLWLTGVTAAFIAYAYELRDIPEEAIHVAEYGFLGFLVYRALVHRIRDYSIYLVAILIADRSTRSESPARNTRRPGTPAG